MNDKKNEEFAPVIVFAYKRLNELKTVIDHLKANEEACYTDLFIYIDGPKNSLESKIVNSISDYCKTINGFRNIMINRSRYNKGLANSVIQGVSEVLNIYNSCIVVEDDIIVSNYFLKFMNDCLKRYRNDRKIFSIGAYCPDIKINDERVYFYPRCETWGWATWDNRWKSVDWNVSDFNLFINDELKIKEFNKGGKDLTPMLKNQIEGKIDSLEELIG